MLKDSDIARYTTRRAHRTYTPAFKAQLVAACLELGASTVALASSHGMNAYDGCMATSTRFPADGGCECGYVRYRVTTAPMVVHCCHCRWCQRGSGASFALNAMYEADRVLNIAGMPEVVDTPSASGAGQKVARCPRCRTAVWSHYAGSGPVTKFVRVGTLDAPDAMPPDIHIFMASKQPWVVIPPDKLAFEEYYERELAWSRASLLRFNALLPQIEAYRAAR